MTLIKGLRFATVGVPFDVAAEGDTPTTLPLLDLLNLLSTPLSASSNDEDDDVDGSSTMTSPNRLMALSIFFIVSICSGHRETSPPYRV